MTLDALGQGALDYLPCRYGKSKLLFRGPRRDLSQPYIAFIGGSETYGKFIEMPFAALTEEALEMNCVNFGYPNAGIDVFTYDPFVLEAANNAAVTVIQVLGAQNMTNRFYSVHPRRNDRFVAPSTLLSTIFREVDFAEFHFNKHMLSRLLLVSPERFDTVRLELQQAWLARMRLLLKQIKGKTVLLWLADHPPPTTDVRVLDGLGSEPLFVTREMIDQISPFATQTVEVVATPQMIASGTDGMMFNPMEQMAAAEMLGTLTHAETANVLHDVIAAML